MAERCGVVGIGQTKYAAKRVDVSLPGGDVSVEWPGEGQEVVMTGPTALAFEGEIAL